MDVLRRSEGEVELETTGAVTSRSRSRGSRSRGSPDRGIVVITTTALQLEDERPEERRQGKGLQHLHRWRAEEIRARAEALFSSFFIRVPLK